MLHCLHKNMFLGYLPELLEIVDYKPIKDRDDDQLYYTNIYLDKKLRDKLKISLDHNAAIFQNLNGALCKLLYMCHYLQSNNFENFQLFIVALLFKFDR